MATTEATGRAEREEPRLPRVITGTHGPEEGAGTGTPWPDDVPPQQDDLWYPLRHDPWRARQVENIIALFWVIAGFCSIGIMVVYWTGGQVQLEGGLLAGATGFLGVGLVIWAKKLLPGHDIVGSREVHHRTSEPEERAAVVESLSRGTDAMMSRRGFLVKKVLGPVGAVFGIALLWPLASLGPRPDRALYKTKWYPVARLVTEDGRAVSVSDVMVDGLLTVFPEGYIDDASSPAVLINVGGQPVQARPGQASFEVISGENGLVCFSKICTHAGCAVSLFNVLSMQLVCPCHQSTFNILEDCKPVFGPAPRPLPQLPLGVDPEGYLIARSDFIEPIGPGFWNRSGD
jgi:ubiquinol-cytochrome c reductase iron-sulfur subunit